MCQECEICVSSPSYLSIECVHVHGVRTRVRRTLHTNNPPSSAYHQYFHRLTYPFIRFAVALPRSIYSKSLLLLHFDHNLSKKRKLKSLSQITFANTWHRSAISAIYITKSNSFRCQNN